MKNIFRIIVLSTAVCFVLGFSEPVKAQAYSDSIDSGSSATTHKTTTHKKSKHKKHKSKSKSHKHSKLGEHSHVQTAQINLTQLGYDPGPADGVMGPHTKSALKAFQRDHHLPATGILTQQTFDALVQEVGSRNPMRNSAAPRENFFASHPDYYGYYDQNYANPTMFGAPQTLTTRYANVQINEQRTGAALQYAVFLNGQQVIQAVNQPSVINVSRTFNLDDADAILFTTYSNDMTCPYQHYLLVVRPNTNGIHQVNNCTRAYEAYIENGNLFISFPGEELNGWSTGDMWRYDRGSLEQL